ncbi:MAG: NAD-dependent epimerase/dehydratase family protein, partial [Patescibacteria group bacterium]
MNTVLVTGSEGNIGTYLVQAIQRLQPDMRIIRVKLREQEDASLKNGNVYVGDLRDPAFVSNLFTENQIDYVIHGAARLYGVAGFNEDVYGILSNDVECLLNVLDQCKTIKKFVYMSSSMVYESSERVPFTEELADEIMPPKSSYGLTKFFGEKAVKFFSQQYGLNYTIWRPFNVVSPLEPHDRKGGHVFIDFYKRLFVDRVPNIEIYGNGQQVRCFTWVEDVVEAIAGSLTNILTDKQVFNIGSSEPKTMIDLKNVLIEIGKEQNLLPQDYNPETTIGSQSFNVDVQLRIPSTEKITRILGW